MTNTSSNNKQKQRNKPPTRIHDYACIRSFSKSLRYKLYTTSVKERKAMRKELYAITCTSCK